MINKISLLIIISALFALFPVKKIAAHTLQIPSLDDWINIGPTISEGYPGDWDQFFWGGFSNHLIKFNDSYIHYYQGSEDYDLDCESVSERAIGVATSNDGFNWSKYPNNPVISWSVNQSNIEEGAVSTAPLVDQGIIYMYYGANTHSGNCLVESDIRVATSTDGVNFDDQGEVLSGDYNANVWGSGDEIFPLGAYTYQGNWYVFYVPNGHPGIYRKLGVAWGPEFNQFTNTASLNQETINVWGSVSVVIYNNTGYLFVNPDTTSHAVDIYTFNPSTPSQVTFMQRQQLTACNISYSILFDNQTQSWLLKCRQQFLDNNLNPPETKTRYHLAKAFSSTPAPSPTQSPTPTPSQPGDANGDGLVNIQDYVILSNTFGSGTDLRADFNGDGVVNIQDYIILSNNFGA